MKPLQFALVALAWAVVPTAAAQDPKDASKKPADAAAAKDGRSTKEAAEEKDAVPAVKTLVEVRLDPFLVPARALNIALPGRIQTLRELLDQMERWSADKEVGAVMLNLDGVVLSIPDIEEVRAGVADLRKAGKKVLAFLNAGDPMGYLLACAADEVAIAPTGSLSIPGIGRLFPFMRGMYQLQGIEYDVITAGAYKYPGFVNRRESDEYFREEIGTILDSWYKDYVRIIVEGRKLSEEKVRKAIDVGLFQAEEAKQYGLVDVIAYHDEYIDRVLRREKFKKSDGLGSALGTINSLQDLMTAISREAAKAQEGYKAVGPKIAVLHARGPIVDMNLGPGFASQAVMRDEFVKSIEEIRKNKTIQAVVLRVDSPGGSAYASDVIWQKLRELDEQKPLVASMGSVAGSGGYFIACPARLIFADATTLTGSIGVLAILANQASMINRLDVNLEEMKRGERSLFGTGHRDLLPQDRSFLQKFILDFYEVFLDRVAVTRKMPKEEVRKIAEGRVYTGRQALELGLIDRLGGLRDAVAAARECANIPASAEIKLVHYPRPSSLGELAESLLGLSAAMEVLTQAQSPAPAIGFDQQLRWFSARPQLLCWMAMPDAVELLAWLAPAAHPAAGLPGLPPRLLPVAPGR